MCAVDLGPPEIPLLPGPSPEASGSYAYHCRPCQRVTVVPVSASAFARLVSVAVNVQEGMGRPRHRRTRLAVDDLIDFHRLLGSHDWFTRLQHLH